MIAAARNFGEVIRRRADADGGLQVLRFLDDGEHVSDAWTYAELDRRARSIAARLQMESRQGERALLLFPPGLEYVAALMGCFYAGVIAIPAYPPDPARLGRTLPRLAAIVADAQASLALTNETVRSLAGSLFPQSAPLASLRWIVTDDASGASYRDPNLERGAVALLQYTSGSTGAPRGVVVRHENLLANSAFIHRAFEHTPDSHSVSWLPPYHDMGLIGGILQALYGGFPTTLMSPLRFLERPIGWLQAISACRANASGGPNFAYDLCARRLKPEDLAALDLTSWKIAFCGAEPIRLATLEAFGAAFAPAGFSRAAFYPCYGLAEATLAVTLSTKGSGFTARAFVASALARNEVRELGPSAVDDANWLVGCGRIAPDHELAIVDPETCERSAPDRVGEIWVRGASVASEYWQRRENSQREFGARLSDGVGPYLRTGDLGFIRDGELFVTGRLKDVLIIQGRNLYAHDIEAIVEASHVAIRRNCCAAFGIEAQGSEQLAIVCEVDSALAVRLEDIAWAIRRAVGKHIEAQLHTVVLIAPRTLPKTSSGKIQRWACQAELARGELGALYRWSVGRNVAGGCPGDSPCNQA